MGGVEREASIVLPLDTSSMLERKYGNLAFIRPFPINVVFANYENEMIHDVIWAKFKGNKRSVTNDGELENEYDLFVIDMKFNI